MNDYNLNLYHDHGSDVIEFKINQMIDQVFGQSIDGIGRNNVFLFRKRDDFSRDLTIVNENGQSRVLSEKIKFTSDPVLSSRGLVLGRLEGKGEEFNKNENKLDQIYQNKMVEFQKQLLNIQYTWIVKYTEHLKISLTERYSEGRPIIKHEAVMLSWAHLMEKQESLKQIIDSNNHADQVVRIGINMIAPSLTREIGSLMGRLAGGRGFLEGQAVNMLVLFEIINQIFFTEEYHGE